MSLHTLLVDGRNPVEFAVLRDALKHARHIAGQTPDHHVVVIDADGRKRFDSDSVLVTVQLMVLPEYCGDLAELADSIIARLADEAGYLSNGDPITPQHVRVVVRGLEVSS